MAGNQYRSLASDIIIRIIRLTAIRLHVIQLLRNEIYAISAQQKTSKKKKMNDINLYNFDIWLKLIVKQNALQYM